MKHNKPATHIIFDFIIKNEKFHGFDPEMLARIAKVEQLNDVKKTEQTLKVLKNFVNDNDLENFIPEVNKLIAKIYVTSRELEVFNSILYPAKPTSPIRSSEFFNFGRRSAEEKSLQKLKKELHIKGLRVIAETPVTPPKKLHKK